MKSPTYRLWVQMKYRCRRGTRYEKNYAGRGIGICDTWLGDFYKFESDMGPRPSMKHSVDRIDNDKGYCKHNCRWATQHEQIMNSRQIVRKGNLPKWVTRNIRGRFVVKRCINGVMSPQRSFLNEIDAIEYAKTLEHL